MDHLAERLRHRLTRLWARLTGAKRRARAAAQAQFRARLAALGPEDLAVDLGANLGEMTAVMAATGARVVAFEPDPHAFDRLSARLAGRTNVTLLNAAAGPQAGRLPLFRHRDFDRAPDKRSQASSLLAGHADVAGAQAVEVEVIDFPAWLRAQPGAIALIKIDIEGAEVALLEALLDDPALCARIGAVFVETHERALPALAARTRALKARSRAMTRPAINWDWH